MLTQTQVDTFLEKGFLLGNRVLTDEQVEELRDELARVIDDYEKDDVKQPVRITNLGRQVNNPVMQIVNIWEASTAYHKLIYNPTIVEEIGAADFSNRTTCMARPDSIQAARDWR